MKKHFLERASLFNDYKVIADALDSLSLSVEDKGIAYYMKEAAQHIRGQNELMTELLNEYSHHAR